MKQSVFATRALVALFAAGMLAQGSAARAGMIEPEAALPAPSQLEQDRAKVQEFLDRANVKQRMQAMGVSGIVAGDRVGALTEQEVHALAQRIDTLPAGGALSNSDLILIVLIALLVALVI